MPRSTLKEHLGCQVYCNHTATNHGLNLQKTPFFSPNSLTSLLQSLADLCWDRSPWKTLVQSNPSVQYPHPRSCGVVSSIRNDTDENLLVFWRWGEQAPKFWSPKLPPSSKGLKPGKTWKFHPNKQPKWKNPRQKVDENVPPCSRKVCSLLHTMQHSTRPMALPQRQFFISIYSESPSGIFCGGSQPHS